MEIAKGNSNMSINQKNINKLNDKIKILKK